jgi:hypothetical protein
MPGKTILLLFVFLSACGRGGETDYAKMYADKIKTHRDLTYRELIADYLKFIDYSVRNPGEDYSPVEDEFYQNYKDSEDIAIRVSDTASREYFYADEKYGVAVYSAENGFYKYGVVFNPDGKITGAFLLAFRFGNNQFRFERDYTVNRNTFTVTDKGYNTEWEESPEKGKSVLSDERSYTVRVDGADSPLIRKNVTLNRK